MTTKYKKYRIIIINEKKLWTKNTFIWKSKKVVTGKCCRHLYYESNSNVKNTESVVFKWWIFTN